MPAAVGPTTGAAGARAPGVPSPTDEALAERAAAGDRRAFGELVERYQDRVYRFALVRVRSRDDAADVAQETLCRAWRSIRRFDPSRRFSTWVLAIAHHEAIGVVRRRARAARDAERERQVRAANERVEPAELPDAWGVARRVLDDRAFELVWLRYAEDRTPAEIARVVGRSAVSVRVALHRARSRLESALRAGGIDDASA